jgi:hypothetical protein
VFPRWPHGSDTSKAEIEIPAFIIEELEDGRFTVFVPSAPTPLSEAIYIFPADRVHPIAVPYTAYSQGSLPVGIRIQKIFVAAMKTKKPPSSETTRADNTFCVALARPNAPIQSSDALLAYDSFRSR